jgi:hypothetical protein
MAALRTSVAAPMIVLAGVLASFFVERQEEEKVDPQLADISRRVGAVRVEGWVQVNEVHRLRGDVLAEDL